MKRACTQKRLTSAKTAAQLRRAAETRLGQHRIPRNASAGGPESAADAQRLLHELEVHQVELEMQNAELQTTREEVEVALEKYADLYEFAPVGYFTLDEQGSILEANLRGSVLLGAERSKLMGRRLRVFVARQNQTVFLNFLEQAFSCPDKQRCEVCVQNATGATFWADLQAVLIDAPAPMLRRLRVVMSDITSLKRSEEAGRQAMALAGINQTLRQEITQRQGVEHALRKAQRRQAESLAEARRMGDQLRHLSHRVLKVQEEERKRISRELHDDIIQTLVGISVHLETVVHAGTHVPKKLKQRISRVQQLVADSVNHVRQFARELRPTMLDDLGLIPSLHAFLKDFAKRTGIRAHLKAFAGEDPLSNDQRTALYRVAHSALTNVAQHAQASRVNVTIRKLADEVEVEICDNGKSFDVERTARAKGRQRLGLLGMRERVQMLGGSLAVESTAGQGTTIRARIPLTEGTPPKPARRSRTTKPRRSA